jgi:membrane peptidoglycan carboxypeptidase
MIVAARLETTLTKDEILQLYLNCVYLGRGAWGVEVAARSYFGKPAKDLTLNEGALLAGLTKGPTYFSPDRQPNRARERLAYVLNRMRRRRARCGVARGRTGRLRPTASARDCRERAAAT